MRDHQSTMGRRIKDNLKRALFRLYKLGARLGVHVLPVHYYSPIPDIIELARTKDVWAKKSGLSGIHIDLDEQIENLRQACLPYQDEYAGNVAYREAVSQRYGPGYGYIEAQALHAVVRHFKPSRIIEVGSGASTHCMLTALALNEQEGADQTAVTCIEPYPSDQLRSRKGIKLIEQKVQSVPMEVFAELSDGDLLFIDSSHTVKAGGDVNYLILEIMPQLQPGTIVHLHDIFLPYDYQRVVLKTFLHWSETSLLRAFLTHNNRTHIMFCLSHLHYDRPDQLKGIFPEYDPAPDMNGLIDDTARPFEATEQHFPSSIYIQIRA